MVVSGYESNLNVGRGGQGPVWARPAMAPPFGYDHMGGNVMWSQVNGHESMVDDSKQYGNGRNRTPSPGAEVGKLGDNFGKLSLQQ